MLENIQIFTVESDLCYLTINEYLFEDRAEKSLLRIMEDADADIMCFGHTHKPYHRILNSGDDCVLVFDLTSRSGSLVN